MYVETDMQMIRYYFLCRYLEKSQLLITLLCALQSSLMLSLRFLVPKWKSQLNKLHSASSRSASSSIPVFFWSVLKTHLNGPCKVTANLRLCLTKMIFFPLYFDSTSIYCSKTLTSSSYLHRISSHMECHLLDQYPLKEKWRD